MSKTIQERVYDRELELHAAYAAHLTHPDHTGLDVCPQITESGEECGGTDSVVCRWIAKDDSATIEFFDSCFTCYYSAYPSS